MRRFSLRLITPRTMREVARSMSTSTTKQNATEATLAAAGKVHLLHLRSQGLLPRLRFLGFPSAPREPCHEHAPIDKACMRAISGGIARGWFG
jgi:hypothetical protein